MVPEPDAQDGYSLTAFDQLRHDLKSPLTTIYGRTQLLVRAIHRSPSLSDEERAKILAGLAVIETSVQRLVTVIDGMSDEQAVSHADEEQLS
jgi:signal transduction histidine kinase